MQTPNPAIGELIRDWLQRRRLSQLDLALEAEISTRHLSFVETGRSAPSREMVLRLADHLEVPPRERNALLLAAGYAPAAPARGLDDPSLAVARAAVERLLAAHEPYPALAVDRNWTLVAANRAVGPLIATASADLLTPPINVLRLSLHPEGLAPAIENLGEWRAHLLHRLRRQFSETGDRGLSDLIGELAAYPAPPDAAVDHADDLVAIPLRMKSAAGPLAFWSTTMVFGAPRDVTVSELALETFLPANQATGERLVELAKHF